MRRLGILVMAAATALAWTGSPAGATVKTSVKTRTYEISGRTGSDLLAAMDRRGPKHGFLTRAIAQTSYSVAWEIDWVRKNGTCSVKNTTVELSITYTYPDVSGNVSPNMKNRWASFMRGVRKHEEMHGTLAKQMVRAADKAVTGFSVRNDPNCRKAQAAVKRRVAEIYNEYESRQVEFDRREHQPGGAVDGLVKALKR